MRNGLIVLDIDGTITSFNKPITKEVSEHLHHLADNDWFIFFITGRPLNWSLNVLKSIDFPYLLGIQNGALILEMPDKKVFSEAMLGREIITKVDSICKQHGTDFILYTTHNREDISYYRPKLFSKEMQKYFEDRQIIMKEKWIQVDSFDELDEKHYSSVKCFGKEDQVKRLAEIFENDLGLQAHPVRDPFSPEYQLVQATNPNASKGHAVEEMIERFRPPVVIVCGDDNNDRPMLEKADIKVVMGSAPKNLLQIADIICGPIEENGIIEGLDKAIALSKNISN